VRRSQAIGRTCGITAVRVSEGPESRRNSLAERLAEEAGSLAAMVPEAAFRVIMDEDGQPLNSAGFADLIKRERDRGRADLVLLIGGPEGHAQSTREGADFILSLGPMTWPHRLARAMVAEQIYRAVTILVNHPYHRQ
jgi:23S rRNA (pseudouridine1915-N3)-methyltransferase